MSAAVRAVFPATTTTTTSGGPTISVTVSSVSTLAGDSLVAIVAANESNDTGITLSATFGGVAADDVSTIIHSNGQTQGFLHIFYWRNPGAVTGSVVATLSSSTNNTGWCAKVLAISGSDNSAPSFTTFAPSGTGVTTACSITSPTLATNGLGIAGFCGGSSFSSTGQTNQSLGNNGTGVDAASCMASCSTAGAGSTVNFTATMSGSDWYGAAAIAIAPASSSTNATVTFPQSILIHP